MNIEFYEFNQVNDQIDCTIRTVEEKFVLDIIFKKRTKKSPNLYKSSFNNKKYIYTNIQEVYDEYKNPVMDKNFYTSIKKKF